MEDHPQSRVAPQLPARSESDLSLPEGLEAGAIGGLVVVLVYLVPDLLAGDWLRTPTLLGGILLGGSAAPSNPVSAGGLAAVYTLVHFAAWAVAGFAAVALVRRAERRPELRAVLPIACAVWIALMVAADLWLAATALRAAHLWVGSVMAGLAVGAYLVWRHPALLEKPQGPGGAGTSA